MTIEFITHLSSMTFENYLQQPKQMKKWLFIRKMKSNLKLLDVHTYESNPLINEIRRRR